MYTPVESQQLPAAGVQETARSCPPDGSLCSYILIADKSSELLQRSIENVVGNFPVKNLQVCLCTCVLSVCMQFMYHVRGGILQLS